MNTKELIQCVYIHAWKFSDQGQEYCAEDESPDGWCAFERTITTEGGDFDHGEEQDFPTLADAITWAEKRADIHNCPVEIY